MQQQFSSRFKKRWHYLEGLTETQAQCQDILREIATCLEELDALDQQHRQVTSSTGSLRSEVDKLQDHKRQLEHFVDDATAKLRSFHEVAELRQQVLAPSLTVTARPFRPLLGRLDGAVAFITNHLHYRSAPASLTQLRQLQSHMLSMIRDSFNSTLRVLATEAAAVLKDTSLTPSLETAALYVKFRAAAPSLKALVSEIERRCGHKGHLPLLTECIQTYLYLRQSLLQKAIQIRLSRFNTLGDFSQMLRAGCDHLLHVCRDEAALFAQFFDLHPPSASVPPREATDGSDTPRSRSGSISSAASVHLAPSPALSSFSRGTPRTARTLRTPRTPRTPGTPRSPMATPRTVVVSPAQPPFVRDMQDALLSMLVTLSEILHRHLRPFIIRMSDLDELCATAHALRADILSSQGHESASRPFQAAALAILQDIQERLAFRSEIFIRDDIRGYVPSPDDLEFPGILEQRLRAAAPSGGTPSSARATQPTPPDQPSVVTSASAPAAAEHPPPPLPATPASGEEAQSPPCTPLPTPTPAPAQALPSVPSEGSDAPPSSGETSLAREEPPSEPKAQAGPEPKGESEAGPEGAPRSECKENTRPVEEAKSGAEGGEQEQAQGLEKEAGAEAMRERKDKEDELGKHSANWYGSLSRTLLFLTKLYHSLESSVFEGLAHDAVSSCVTSLIRAARLITKKSAALDAQLFLVHHLLLLREHIAPFDLPFSVIENRLDFSRLADAWERVKQGSNLFALNTSNTLVDLISHVPPRIQVLHHNSRQELELEIKSCCRAFLNMGLRYTIEPLMTRMDKVGLAIPTIDGAFAPPPRPLAASYSSAALATGPGGHHSTPVEPESLPALSAELGHDLRTHLPRLRLDVEVRVEALGRKIGLYVQTGGHRSLESLLLFPVRTAAQDVLSQLDARLATAPPPE